MTDKLTLQGTVQLLTHTTKGVVCTYTHMHTDLLILLSEDDAKEESI